MFHLHFEMLLVFKQKKLNHFFDYIWMVLFRDPCLQGGFLSMCKLSECTGSHGPKFKSLNNLLALVYIAFALVYLHVFSPAKNVKQTTP